MLPLSQPVRTWPEERDDYDFRGGKATTLTFRATTIGQLAATLRPASHYPIVDRTGLTGTYNFTLTLGPQQISAEHIYCDLGPCTGDWPSVLFEDSSTSHLLKKLGLKLVHGKRPVEFMVIDHVERPDAN